MSRCSLDRARDLLDTVDVGEAAPRRVGRLAAYDGLMLEATGFTRPIGAGARIVAGDGQVRAPKWSASAATAPC